MVEEWPVPGELVWTLPWQSRRWRGWERRRRLLRPFSGSASPGARYVTRVALPVDGGRGRNNNCVITSATAAA